MWIKGCSLVALQWKWELSRRKWSVCAWTELKMKGLDLTCIHVMAIMVFTVWVIFGEAKLNGPMGIAMVCNGNLETKRNHDVFSVSCGKFFSSLLHRIFPLHCCILKLQDESRSELFWSQLNTKGNGRYKITICHLSGLITKPPMVRNSWHFTVQCFFRMSAMSLSKVSTQRQL